MNEFRLNISIACLLAAACVALYANTLSGEWVWDDASSVLLHRHVQEPGQFFKLFAEDQHAFGRGQGNFYRPLVSAGFMLDYYIAGGPRPDQYPEQSIPEVAPLVFHITNMFWHLLAALFLLALLIRMDAPFFVRWAAPLLFITHPLHTEATAYISGRADMMSAAGMFSGLYFAVGAMQLRRPTLNTVLSCLCFAAGLLSKESTLIYPFLLVLVYFAAPRPTPDPGHSEKKWAPYMPIFSALMVLAVYLALRATLLRFADSGEVHAASFSRRLMETLLSLGIYIRLLFVPANLHMERTLNGVSNIYGILGIAFLVAWMVGMVAAWKCRRKRMAAGMGWFVISWLPISGLFPLNAPLAEHWMYVPMAGFWWACAELIGMVAVAPGARKTAYALVLALSLAFGVATLQRNRDWHDNETLFLATLRQNPDSARVHYNLAVTYEDLKANYAGARRHYEEFLRIRGQAHQEGAPVWEDEIEARFSLGRVLMRLQAYPDAIAVLSPLIQLAEVEAWRMTAARAALQTGLAWLALGEVMQAGSFFDRASQLEPQFAGEIERMNAGVPFLDAY